MNEGHYPDSPGYAKHSDTSLAAAQSIDAKTLRAVILRMIVDVGIHGMTADEAAHRLDRVAQTVSPRFTELAQDTPTRKAEIFDSGQRRRTRQGRLAAVWIAKPKQMPLV